MEEWVKVVILGIIEGLTEFLPVSSTGHLVVASYFLELRASLQGVFEIFIQSGAVVAVILYYWPDLWRQARTIRHDKNVQQLWRGIIIAFIPAAATGFLLEEAINDLLFTPVVVAIALIAGGILFIIVERYVVPRMDKETQVQDIERVTTRQAVTIGIWQVFALIPGTSRSGMSILGGMISGLDRKVATQFSFYLALPTLGGATIYKFLTSLDQISGSDMVLLILGAVISGIVAGASIAWLLRYVARNNFIPFGVYRIIVGVIILVLMASGIGG
ncbi:MAG: undecaprenyl-diphosphate phosphatase [Anaerolineaceae bacterium]|nr:undecaprenyl-diphosphate phosphatase [Anaerolineaceae bacterium]